MSLTERLEDLTESASSPSNAKIGCKLIRIVNSDSFTDAERKKFIEILDVPVQDPKRVTSAALTRLLRAEGFKLSDKAVERHRAKNCGCDSTAGATK